MANIRETSTSRLVQNSENIRARLASRNTYDIGTEYPIKTDSFANKVLDSVNALAQIVTPYSGYDLRNTVFGRAIEDRTPLTEFGLVMLGKQFAMNAIKRAANNTIPIIKPSNLLPWRDGKLFTNRKNLSITIDSTVGGFQRFIEDTIHFYPNSRNPFTNTVTNKDYLQNTGQAQLDFLYGNINKNLFTSAEIRIFAGDDNVPTRVQNLTPNKLFFTKGGARSRDFHPYVSLNYLNVIRGWEIEANLAMQESLEYLADSYPDYGADLEYINEVLGKSHKEADYLRTELYEENDEYINSWIDKDSGFSREAEDKIVWGRDGISVDTDSELSTLRGVEDSVFGNRTGDLDNRFNVRAGLLEYTRNLINSNGGHGSGDITRKVFTKDDKIVGFNGNALWKAPNNALERFRDKVGLRQHSVLDQYGTFAKAIRFDGNSVYEGNPDSVIYRSVMPKIHPILNDDNQIDSRNMMFSIENLAVHVINPNDGSKEVSIDDEYGTKIPISEVGPFEGRMMWFPPYNLEFSETHAANFESTVMVGRNEPMYNYLHSERAAVIRFSLIIDYPPQLRSYRGADKHKKIAEFFAFGGDYTEETKPDIDKLERRRDDIEKEIEEILPKPKTPEIPDLEVKEIRVSFPNDIPSGGTETNIFDVMYKMPYEINKNIMSIDGGRYGLNADIYYPQGIYKGPASGLWWFESNDVTISQYTYNPLDNQPPIPDFNSDIGFDGKTELDKMLLDAFNDADIRKYFKIIIEAGSSKRYYDTDLEAQYNFELGKRRAQATKTFIEARLKTLFGAQSSAIIIELGGTNNTGSFGSVGADIKNATKERIGAEETKQERFSSIKIERTSAIPEPVTPELDADAERNLTLLREELDKVERQIRQGKKQYNINTFREKKIVDDELNVSDAGKSSGFKNISENYYSPAFHSQTPEDFHRRLTFLHQCMRQGKAVRYETEIDDTGTPRARNSVFGRQPICVLRIGDFFYTKIIIDNLTIDYSDAPWDMNPEGFGMQPMIADITLNIKIMGGQSLAGPINVLQNAMAFNWYANSTYTDKGLYATPSRIAVDEQAYLEKLRIKRDEENNNE